MQPGGNDGKLLLHAVRIGRDGLGKVVRQRKKLGILADARLPRFRLHAEDVGDKIEVLDARHKLVEVGVIRDVGEHLLAGDGIVLNGMSADGDRPRVKLLDANDGLERCGLARAVVPDEAVNLARRDVERQIVHSLLLAEGFAQVVNIEHVLSLFSFRLSIAFS